MSEKPREAEMRNTIRKYRHELECCLCPSCMKKCRADGGLFSAEDSSEEPCMACMCNEAHAESRKLSERADLAAERERGLVRALEWYEICLKDINRRGNLGETARATLARDAGAFALRALKPHSREGGEE